MARLPKRLGRGLSSLIPMTPAPHPSQDARDVEEGGTESQPAGEMSVPDETAVRDDVIEDEHAGRNATQRGDGGGGATGHGGAGSVSRDVPDASDTTVALQRETRRTPRGAGSDSKVSLYAGGRAEKGDEKAPEARMVEVRALHANRYQPRSDVDDDGVKTLSQSVASHGVLQPIVARETAEGLEIIAGERRWRAARVAGLKKVPVLVREASDEQMLELALVENIHREDLNAVDRALAYRRYCEVFGLSAEAVAALLGEDRTTVTNYVRLLELPEAVRALLSADRISMGHARSLLGVPDELRKIELATMVAANGMSVRSLEELVRRERPRRVVPVQRRRRSAGPPDAHIREMEGQFESVLETKVKIHLGQSGADGRIVVEFFSLDEFDRIAKRIGVGGEKSKGLR